jgi:uncharacterized membrane protein YphA (DoxX/SURF4 family)
VPAGSRAVRRNWLGTLARVLLAGVFAVAGAAKVTDLAGAARAVAGYRLVPFPVAAALGAGLPFVELALAAFLLVGLATRLVAGISAVLLAGYFGAIASVWARGIAIDCGCFGGGGALAAGTQPNYFWELLRDAVLFAVAVFVLFAPRTPMSVDGFVEGAEET